ncbi:MAG: FAD-dependent oxidoreductase [Nanoarchaeota archaeon]
MKIINKKKKVVIIGAGIAGLASAYYFSADPSYEVIVVEKESFVGGLAHGFDYKGFHFDFGPHKIATVIPGIVKEMNNVTPLLRVEKRNKIYLKDNYFQFPLKISQVAKRIPLIAVKAGIDLFTKSLSKMPDDSYENYLLNRFGKTLYSLSFKDYAEKVWNTPGFDLDKELAIRRVAVSSLAELIKKTLTGDTSGISVNFFHYPPKGMKQLSDNLKKSIEDNGGIIYLQKIVSEIKVKDRKIESLLIGRVRIKPDYVISTIFPDYLINIIKDSDPAHVKAKVFASKLKYQPVSVLYIILNKERALNDCWVFFPEKKFLFHRVSEQKAFSPQSSPPGKTGLMVETTKEPTKENVSIIIDQLKKVGIIKDDSEIEEHFIKTGPRVYPVYLKGFLENLDPTLKYFDSIKGLYVIGRPGRFNYNNTDQSWDMALQVYNHVKSGENSSNWEVLKQRFDAYRIVD